MIGAGHDPQELGNKYSWRQILQMGYLVAEAKGMIKEEDKPPSETDVKASIETGQNLGIVDIE